MADLLHADAIQQLEVALLGTTAPQVIEVLAGGLTLSTSFMGPTQPYPKGFTSTPPAPVPTLVPILGVTSSSSV